MLNVLASCVYKLLSEASTGSIKKLLGMEGWKLGYACVEYNKHAAK